MSLIEIEIIDNVFIRFVIGVVSAARGFPAAAEREQPARARRGAPRARAVRARGAAAALRSGQTAQQRYITIYIISHFLTLNA